MCVIFHFQPGAMMDKQSFVNSVHNNWNGYGLILKDGNGKLQVFKDCPEEHNDPEMLWKMIESNVDCDRYLHIRHATKGAVNLMNAQPFPVYHSDKREVYFMHNGTLTGFGEGWSNPRPEDKSDTLDFCEKILGPVLLRLNGENGKGDYTDDVFLKLVLEKYWSHGNRGLFISNDLDPVYYGKDWTILDKSEEAKDKPKVFVSNELYFKEITRGPFFEARQRAIREAAEKERLARGEETTGFGRTTNTTTSTTIDVKAYDMEKLAKSAVILRALSSLFQNGELDTLEGCAKLSQVTLEEWDEMVTSENSMYMASLISRITDELLDAKTKIDNQDKDITRMQTRLTNYALKEKEQKAA